MENSDFTQCPSDDVDKDSYLYWIFPENMILSLGSWPHRPRPPPEGNGSAGGRHVGRHPFPPEADPPPEDTVRNSKYMWQLYVLINNTANRHYIGIAEDVEKRLIRHNRGDVRSTKAYRPWKLLYCEQYDDKTTARKRELFLKRTARARKELFSRLKILASSSNG
ncbi:MAG: GIY-YIG nuclease family protein [bacterium]|nr:GIY-YIG nuclease family protein [bacterium]